MAVSLSEITSIGGDPRIAAGAAGTGANLADLPADQLGLQILNSAANARMMANKYALDLQQQNVRDYLQNFNSLEVQGVMEADYPAITAEYAKLASDIASNYDIIANPLKNQERYAELRGREAQLRGKIQQSKQHVALRGTYGNFISQHRDFQTPENLAKIEQFSAVPMEQRDIAAITTIAPRYDTMQPDIAKVANQIAMQKTKQQDDAKPFQSTTEMTTYQETEYNNAVRSLLRGQDGFSRPMMAAVGEAFRTQAPQVQEQFTNLQDGSLRLEDFAVQQLYGPLRMQTDLTVIRDPNQFSLLQAQGDQAIRREREQGEQARRTLQFQKKLAEEELNLVAAEIPVRQLAVFGAPDKPGAAKEFLATRKAPSGNTDADRAIDKFSSLFNVPSPREVRDMEVTPVTLDTWMTNAYSIPSGKRSVIDEETGKTVEQDTYLRPKQAWVTGEADPNARKVVVRYQPEGGEARDVILPYAEHFQILNNVAGQTNAVKLGGAKVRLLRDLTGNVSPNYQELDAIELFKNPNTGTPGVGAAAAGAVPGARPPGTTPQNASTGAFLNATEYKKMKAAQKAKK